MAKCFEKGTSFACSGREADRSQCCSSEGFLQDASSHVAVEFLDEPRVDPSWRTFGDAVGEVNVFADFCTEEVPEFFSQSFIECWWELSITAHVVCVDNNRFLSAVVVHAALCAVDSQEFFRGSHAHGGGRCREVEIAEVVHGGGELRGNGCEGGVEAVVLIGFSDTERCAELCTYLLDVHSIVSLQCIEYLATCFRCDTTETFDGEDRGRIHHRRIRDNLRNRDFLLFWGREWEDREHRNKEGMVADLWVL